MSKPAAPVLSRAFFATYIAIAVLFLVVSYGTADQRIVAGLLDRLGVLAQVVGTGAQGTSFHLAGTVFLLTLLPVNVLHSVGIVARTGPVPVAPSRDPVPASMLVLFAGFWLLCQACVFLIPADSGPISRFLASSPAVFAVTDLIFLYAGHFFLSIVTLGVRRVRASQR